ncbi:hypothetical protein [uncultured Microbacterium sp.]|uniref:hypothetical protein n=1 Tax=uncultured Microbacterium sp. TaxID=191216 RepID=UPI0026100544|nr:hypothetical protein [uncultured Microbacterium sp.]
MSYSWPHDSRTVEQWLQATLCSWSTADQETRLHGLERIRIDAALDGLDLRRLDLDARDLDLRVDVQPENSSGARSEATAAEPEPLMRESGMLREFRLHASPLRIEGMPIDVDLRARDVPIEWAVFAEPLMENEPASDRMLAPRAGGGRASLDASMRTADIAPLIAAIARPLLAQANIGLRSVSLDVRGSGASRLKIRASARVQWKRLTASVSATVRLCVSPDAVVEVRSLKLNSRNPLIAVALLFARKHVNEVVGDPLGLNAGISAAGVSGRFHSVALTGGGSASHSPHGSVEDQA